MKQSPRLAICFALVLTGCASTPKAFYADAGKQSDIALCRAALDPSQEFKFRQDVATELTRRGLTGEVCQSKINTQNAVIAGAIIVGVTSAAVIACNNNACPSGGGGGSYIPDDVDCYGGGGNGPRWQYGPIYVGYDDPYDLDRDGDGIGCEASGEDY